MTIKYGFYFVLGVLLFASCDDYLERTPEAEITEEEMFNSYGAMQGFLDLNYWEMPSYLHQYPWRPHNYGGEAIPASMDFHQGNYRHRRVLGPHAYSLYHYTFTPRAIRDKYRDGGIWHGGWRSIRRCNYALQKLHLLHNATEEEKKLLEGQIYFFRAYFHEQIIENFGGMPYIDTVYEASDILRQPRLNYQECADRVIEDLDKAIPLLPEDWDDTSVGKERVGANTGRITKGAALAFKQKFLLYAGSPLMNGFSGNDFTYNKEYCKKAAAAGWEMIQLANKGLYSLVPMEDYSINFHNSNDGTVVWCSETILNKAYISIGFSQTREVTNKYAPVYLRGAKDHSTASQNFVDRFEMADGTRYKVEYDYDDSKRWQNRDPRFYENIYVDRDKVGDHPNSVYHGYIGPEINARPANGSQSPYLIRKFISWGLNSYDNQWRQFRAASPLMRLAEVYLDYAEAVTAAYGPNGSAPGANLTAVDAINIIRARAGMPPATAAAEGYDSFMDLVWNERCVELTFEGNNYWNDIRRWYVAHLPEYKELYTMNFDKDWTYFNRELYLTRVFDNPKHYWMPIYQDQVQLYPEFYQNPGW